MFRWLKQNDRWMPLAVLLLSLGVHALYLATSGPRDPTFLEPLIDAKTYDDFAWSVASGQVLPPEPFFQPPLLPYFLVLIYSMFGHSVLAAKVALAAAGSVTCMLTCLLARRLFGARAGLLAGCMAALYAPLFFYDCQLFPAGLGTLSGTLALWLLARSGERGTRISWFLSGAAIGIAALAVSNFLLVPLVVGIWLLARASRDGLWKEAAVRIALVGLGVAAAVLPVTIRNAMVSRQPVLISTNGGINLYIGNNERAMQTMAIRPGLDWDVLERAPLRAGVTSASQADAFFRRQVLGFIRREPAQFVRLLLYKVQLLVNSRELPRTEDPYTYRAYSPLLAALMWKAGPFGFPWGLAFPLAVLGMLIAWHRCPASRWLAGFVVVYGLSVALFFVSSRHRLVLVPSLLTFAAFAIAWLFDRRVATGMKGSALFATAIVGVFVNWPVVAPTDRFNFEAEKFLLLGLRAVDRQDPAAAERLYRRSLEIDPDFADAYNQLGNLRMSQGRADEAIAAYRDAIRVSPSFAEAHNNLGLALQGGGRLDEAAAEYRAAIRLRPELSKPHANLGQVLLVQKQTAPAIAEFRASILLDLLNSDAYNMLAWVLATHPDAAFRNGSEAVRFAGMASHNANESNPSYLDTLAAAYAEAGRFSDAVAAAEKAVRLGSSAGQREWAARVRQRLLEYRQGRPYRDESLAGK